MTKLHLHIGKHIKVQKKKTYSWDKNGYEFKIQYTFNMNV